MSRCANFQEQLINESHLTELTRLSVAGLSVASHPLASGCLPELDARTLVIGPIGLLTLRAAVKRVPAASTPKELRSLRSLYAAVVVELAAVVAALS